MLQLLAGAQAARLHGARRAQRQQQRQRARARLIATRGLAASIGAPRPPGGRPSASAGRRAEQGRAGFQPCRLPPLPVPGTGAPADAGRIAPGRSHASLRVSKAHATDKAAGGAVLCMAGGQGVCCAHAGALSFLISRSWPSTPSPFQVLRPARTRAWARQQRARPSVLQQQ